MHYLLRGFFSFSLHKRMVLIVGLLAIPALGSIDPVHGSLHITITDATSNTPVPARVEILASDQKFHVASDALRVGGDCDMSDNPSGLVDLQSTLAHFNDRIDNPYTRSTQFYSDGSSTIQLPIGQAILRVFKGPEYQVSKQQVDVIAGGETRVKIELQRWINMPEQGWYSSDDHLHIPRPVVELNPYISKMMQAEDIHVANLLQMGKVKNFTNSSQYAHGSAGVYREGHYLLAPGQ